MHKTLRDGLALTVLLALFPSFLCARPPKSATSFKIRSSQTNPAGDPLQTGKCLDYGKAPSLNSATVFLNDCAKAHAIRVVEMADQKGSDGITRSHQVMLFAHNLVLGIHNPNPLVKTLGGSASAPAFSTQSEFVLELQIPWNAPHANALVSRPANQIFAYDGDSIILESSRPCVNTDATTSMNLCSPPPPQLVIQVQNARGANGSLIVAGVRSLADNEFWDFVPLPGSQAYPTKGFISTIGSPPTPITSNWQLWNAVCAPQVAASTASPIIAGSMPPQPLLDFKANTAVACSASIGWGNVVVVAGSDPNECGNRPDVGPCIDLSNYPPITLPAGATLRGNRRGTSFGPQMFDQFPTKSTKPNPLFHCESCMLEVRGDYVRVTGLRVRGQSRSTDESEPSTVGIVVGFPGPPDGPLPFSPKTLTEFIAVVDRNDTSDWGAVAVEAGTPYSFIAGDPAICTYPGFVDSSGNKLSYTCGPTDPGAASNPGVSVQDHSTGAIARVPIVDDPATLANVRIERNFVHHNQRDNLGYGIGGGRAVISGNTFLQNRHAIASDGEPHSEYRASYNLVLSGSSHHDQDFDMHGTNNGYGGVGGFHVDIVGNTFLGTNRQNYWLRGFPSRETDFHRNITLSTSLNDAVQFRHCSPVSVCLGNPFPIRVFDQQFGFSDPTTRFGPASLGVGDFDGDGDDDLFLTTGASWYYSPAGAREWRFLSAKTDMIDSLLLGDFDGDGRTDVVGMNPSGQFDVSWGGISDWEVINKNPCPQGVPDVPKPCPKSIQNMVVGDFDGDGTPDIFYADGKKNWYISYGGTKPFKKVNDSSFLVQALRFGHFSVCGMGKETDAFGIVSGKWMVTCGALGPWIPLHVSLTNKIDGLTVADFDGDGIADVATNDHNDWMISYGGVSAWKHYNVPDTDKCASPQPALPLMPAIGHFARNRGADVLLWDRNGGNEFCIAAGGNAATKVGWTSGLQPYSTQDMR